MNSRHIFLLSLLCLAHAARADDSFEESLRKKSLEEVRVLYQEELKRLEPTIESQRVLKQEQLVDGLKIMIKNFALKCTVLESYCQEAIKVEKILNSEKKMLDFAERKLEEANPRLKAIKDCLQEKEYEAIEIK